MIKPVKRYWSFILMLGTVFTFCAIKPLEDRVSMRATTLAETMETLTNPYLITVFVATLYGIQLLTRQPKIQNDVEFGIAFAPVDEDTMRAIEPLRQLAAAIDDVPCVARSGC